MSQIEDAMDGLMTAIRNSEEFIRYQAIKEKVHGFPKLESQITEFRKKNYLLQNSQGTVDLYEETDRMENEYREFRKNPMASEYCYDFGYRVFTEAPVDAEPGRDVIVQISDDMSDMDIAKELKEKGLVENAKLFFVQLKVSAYSGRLHSGVYTLNTSMTARDMMVLMAAKPEQSSTDDTETVTGTTEETTEETTDTQTDADTVTGEE